jgi:mRNA-degrading endonuclease RelE of RelBE toxin-antitoxin system
LTKVYIESSARRDLKRLSRNIVHWVLNVIDKLEENPFIGERLHIPASLRGLYCFKLRHGDYRLIYCYIPSRDAVYIIAVGHRDEIYEMFRRRIK